MANLKSKISAVPQKPGVYRFLSKNGEILYIGKAKNLRARLKQYFQKNDDRPQIPFLMQEAADFDYTVVNNELESLYLESTLIKQHLPKYNILLRDDKNYAFIKIDYSTQIPQIGYARKLEQGNQKPNPKTNNLTPNAYFGPFTAAYKIRNTLHLMRKIFPYCSAQKVSGRPCFHYYLHRCPGVCIGKISIPEYLAYLKKIEDFLAGNNNKINKQLQNEMKIAAAKKQFEKAARLRDQINSLLVLEERQTVILTKKVDWDIVSLGKSSGYACVNLFKVREGKLRDKENFVYSINDAQAADANIIQNFLEQYYLETSSWPKIIYSQITTTNPELVEQIINTRFKHKIQITAPQKGKPAELIKLGIINAQEHLNKWLQDQAGHLDKINQALLGLKAILHLPEIPKRIECYDISNIQGTNAVGSMVVFKNGLPAKAEYRKFKIRTKSTPDDFAMMREILTRRISRSTKSQEPNSKISWPLPGLIVIDGGKGQLNAALAAISKSKTQMPNLAIIGLAKRIEEIFLPNKPESIILPHDDPSLQLLQRLRDEAHRFGITFHRQLRSKQAVKSALDDIPGIGPKTKKLLKQKFGTVASIKKLPLEELSAVVGKKTARSIQQML